MWKVILKIVFLALGLIILCVSISRASLELLIENEKNNSLRKISFESDMVVDGKVIGKISYRIPESRTLPSSSLYKLKKVRDSLWINFIKRREDKARLLLLIADKQMGEVLEMSKKEADKELLIGTMIESANKLKLASEEVKNLSISEIEIEKIKKQIKDSKYVYKEISKSLEIKEEEKERLINYLE
jgi:Domain of unknown function (DUF5667)